MIPSILKYITGLEWVNDQTCVLVFTSRKSALQAWNALCRTPQSVNAVLDDLESVSPIEVDVTNEIARPAQPLPLALYPMEDRINTVLGNLLFRSGDNGFTFNTLR